MSWIYQPKRKCKDGGSYFYKSQKYRQLENEKNVFFSYFISGIPKFSFTGFLRKCSMFSSEYFFKVSSQHVVNEKKSLSILQKIYAAYSLFVAHHHLHTSERKWSLHFSWLLSNSIYFLKTFLNKWKILLKFCYVL